MIGLAPMDGVTDPAFRFIVDKYGHPDMLFTEFVSVEGLEKNPDRLSRSLIHHKTKTLTIAQLFGSDPELFYKSALLVAKLGFDGVDINMGCPDRSITRKGGGAALINNPKLAKEIISSVKQALKCHCEERSDEAIPLTLSVKTRIGYHEPITEKWISSLIEEKPDFITIHGRTFSQMYSGLSDWNEIEKAVKISKNSKVKIFGNGDIKSLAEAKDKIKTYSVDGVLIGRASLGNPWVFTNHVPSKEEKFQVMIEHCQKFQELTPNIPFVALRKHLGWYCKGFDGAAQLRNNLMKVNNLNDVINMLQ